jgi:hypothetical protein
MAVIVVVAAAADAIEVVTTAGDMMDGQQGARIASTIIVFIVRFIRHRFRQW